jgi:hypothetical protein
MASISTTCAVLGAEGVGKSSFISKYLYNYIPAKYIPTKHPKSSTYTFTFPPPTVSLHIIEHVHIPDTAISSAVLVYDPLQPMTLDYVEKLLADLESALPRKIGLVLVALVRGNNKVGRGRAVAAKYHAHFFVADLNKRNSIKQAFAICFQWGRKNLAWESRKPLVCVRETVRLNLQA